MARWLVEGLAGDVGGGVGGEEGDGVGDVLVGSGAVERDGGEHLVAEVF